MEKATEVKVTEEEIKGKKKRNPDRRTTAGSLHVSTDICLCLQHNSAEK